MTRATLWRIRALTGSGVVLCIGSAYLFGGWPLALIVAGVECFVFAALEVFGAAFADETRGDDDEQ